MRIDQPDALHLSHLDAVKFDRGIGNETRDRILGIDLINCVLASGKEIPDGPSDSRDKQERHERESRLRVDIVSHRAHLHGYPELRQRSGNPRSMSARSARLTG